VALPASAAAGVGVVEAVKDFDLDDDLPPGRQPQHPLEPLPVLGIPLGQVVAAVVQPQQRIRVALVPVRHRVADVVAAGGLDLIEVLLQVRDLEQVVVDAAAEQHHRLAAVLPVGGVLFIRPDPIGIGRPSGSHGNPAQQHGGGRKAATIHDHDSVSPVMVT